MVEVELEGSPAKKAKIFCPRTFRQELKGNEVLKSLKRFVTAAKNSDEIVYEYLDNGGSLQEILSLIDITAKGDLTTALPVFEVVHLILVRFQSLDSSHHQRCLDGARTILNSHLMIIKTMLSMNIAKQKKVALKLLTAMVTLHSSFATEIMNVMALSPTLIADLIQLGPEKESVRKYFILFILSFLVDGNTAIIKNLLDKKGFLSTIIPGLKFDEPATVNLTLSLFEEKILKDVKISKTLKLKLFNTQVIKSLFDLYDWKGPQSTKQLLPKKKNKVKAIEVNQKDKELVVDSVHSFLLLLCCSKKYGVAFVDKSMGTSDELNNQLLLTVFESLSDPLKNKKIAEVLLKSIASCPDIMKSVLLKLEPSFQPRNSKNWFQAVEFAENLILEMDSVTLLKSETGHLSASHILRVAKTLCTPAVFLRIAKLGAQKTQPIEIRLCSLRLLSSMWSETQKLAEAFQKFAHELTKSMNHHISKFLPDVGDLVELWHTICNPQGCTVSQEKRPSFLSAILKCLHVIVGCQTDAISSPLGLASDMLQSVESLRETMNSSEFSKIEVKIVEFVVIDLQSLTPDMELFEKSLLILLRSTDTAALSYASRILANLDIFKRNRAEVEVWVLAYISLPEDKRHEAADYLIESIRKFTSDDTEINNEEPSLTYLVFHAVETLKRHSKEDKASTFRCYICDVIIHLQHFYKTDLYLYDQFKDCKKILSKSVLNYLKGWKSGSVGDVDQEVISCPQELGMVSWLLHQGDIRPAEEIISTERADSLKMFSLFRTAVAYLTLKTVNGDLGEKDTKKFVDVLSFFLKRDAIEYDEEKPGLVSFDLKNEAVYKRNCLECLFLNQTLLNAFDVFSKKESGDFHATSVVFKVLIESGAVKDTSVKRKLSERWKGKFLKQLKAKLKKSKSIHGTTLLERTLDFFDYEESDVMEVVELFMKVPDLDLFVSGQQVSAWMTILSKFVKLSCCLMELTHKTVQKLCSIMKHLSEKCANMEVVDNCFVHLLREHPRHLLLVENDFLEVILRRTKTTEATLTLGKLLLNDPAKVKFFLKLIAEDWDDLGDPQLVFSLIAVLIPKDDTFLDVIKPEGVWKSSEIEASSEIGQTLRVIYDKFQEIILRAMAGLEEEVICKNIHLTRELIRLFIGKKNMKQLRKEMPEGKFQPELVFEAVRKLDNGEITTAYIQGLLTMFCRLIKKAKDVEGESKWVKLCSIFSEAMELKQDSWEEVYKSSQWKEFGKLAMAHCFSTMKHPAALKIFRLLIMRLDKVEVQSKDTALFFQMLISHSHFLDIILSGSPLKTELVELFHCLIVRSPSEMSPKHVPILLAAYTAKLLACDQTLLRILRFYEKNGVKVSDYEPFVWGEAAVSHYSIGTNPGLSLWQRFNMANVLDLLEEQRMRASLTEFPIDRGLEVNESVESNPNVYDPAFLLPLFVNLLSPGAVVFPLPFIYKGGLGYTVRALSSENKDIRSIACVVLARFYSHLEMSQNMKQKLVWMHYINCFRYGIEDLSAQPLPNIVSLFGARMSLELSSPPAEMYLPLQNYLLAKSYFALDTVPEFLPLFHSSEVSYGKHREWLLEVLRDGTKTTLDLNTIFHSMAIKVIFCFFHSQLCDIGTKKLILQVIERLLRVEKSILIISEYGLLDWINSIDFFQPVLQDLLKLLSASTSAVITDLNVHKNKHTNASFFIQILNIGMRLLPGIKALKSIQVFHEFLKFMYNCLVLFISSPGVRRDWFKLHKNRVCDLIETGVVILGKENDCGKFREMEFYFRDYNDGCSSEVAVDLKKCVYLFNRLSCKDGNTS